MPVAPSNGDSSSARAPKACAQACMTARASSSAHCAVDSAHARYMAGNPRGSTFTPPGASQLGGADHGARSLVAVCAGGDPTPWQNYPPCPLTAGAQSVPRPGRPGRAARKPIRSPWQVRQKSEAAQLVAHWVPSNLLPAQTLPRALTRAWAKTIAFATYRAYRLYGCAGSIPRNAHLALVSALANRLSNQESN